MRVAIILNDVLNKGEAANASAILMGQMTRMCPEIYSDELIYDKTGFIHSGVKYSTIILKGKVNEIVELCFNISKDNLSDDLKLVIFTEEGKSLNDEFEPYKQIIQTKQLNNLTPVAVIIAGKKKRIIELTSNFKLY